MMMFAQVAEPVAVPAWVAALTATAITVGMICQIILQVLAKFEAAKVSNAAADAAQTVKTTLASSTATSVAALAENTAITRDTKAVADSIHVETNSKHRIALDAISTLSQTIADLTGKPVDVMAAATAAKALAAHDARQP